jgi:hypothetical protein
MESGCEGRRTATIRAVARSSMIERGAQPVSGVASNVWTESALLDGMSRPICNLQ